MEPDSLVGAQRAYFQSGATRPLSARRQALLALRRAVALHQDDIARALFLDLGKSKSEAYLTETGLVLQELSFLLRRLPSLAAPKRVKTPPALFPATSRVMRVPFGVTLQRPGGGKHRHPQALGLRSRHLGPSGPSGRAGL